MAKTIVLSNQKGGVGKTTTANALALIFRERGYKVLAVDLDPQGNLSFSTGADTDGTATIYEVLKEEVKPRFAIQKTGLVDIIPSNILLSSIELEFTGEGMDEKGIDKATGKVLVEVSPDFYRPTDVVNLWGDPTKARTELGWNPTKTSFEELVRIMTEHDMQKVAVERAEEDIKCNLEEYLEKGVVK